MASRVSAGVRRRRDRPRRARQGRRHPRRSWPRASPATRRAIQPLKDVVARSRGRSSIAMPCRRRSKIRSTCAPSTWTARPLRPQDPYAPRASASCTSGAGPACVPGWRRLRERNRRASTEEHPGTWGWPRGHRRARGRTESPRLGAPCATGSSTCSRSGYAAQRRRSRRTRPACLCRDRGQPTVARPGGGGGLHGSLRGGGSGAVPVLRGMGLPRWNAFRIGQDSR
jgi:hypothetical protein